MSDDLNYKIPLSDLQKAVRKKKSFILSVACLSTFFVFIYLLSTPLLYKAEGVFEDSELKNSSLLDEKVLANFFLNMSTAEIGKAMDIMQSKQLLIPLIEEMGLQGKISLVKPSFMGQLLDNISVQLLWRWRKFTNSQALYEPLHHSYLKVSHLHYLGPRPYLIKIVIDDLDSYSTYLNDTLIGHGKFGASYVNNDIDIHFTLNLINETLVGNSLYLKIEPIEKIVNLSRKYLSITPSSYKKSFIEVAFQNADKSMVANFVNSLMNGYIDYLIKEHHTVNQQHINYLDHRKKELDQSLIKSIDEHASMMYLDCHDLGFPYSEDAVEYFTNRLKILKQQAFQIDTSLEMIDHYMKSGLMTTDKAPFLDIPQEVIAIKKKLFELDCLDEPLTSPNDESEDAMLFAGISLENLERLYAGYCQQLGQCVQVQQETERVLDQINQESVELAAVMENAKNGVSRGLIEKINHVSLALKDCENRSEREKKQLEAQLITYKKFLKEYADETLRLNQIESKNLEKKMYALKKAKKDVVAQKKDQLYQKMKEEMFLHAENLKRDKALVQKQQEELKEHLAYLPKKWLSEKYLGNTLAVHERLVHEVGRLVEAKNISQNVDIFYLKPLDYATEPAEPEALKLTLISLSVFIVTVMLTTLFVLVRLIKKGIPVSCDNLAIRGFYVAGKIQGHFIADKQKSKKTMQDAATYFVYDRSLVKEPLGQALLSVQGFGPDMTEELGSCLAQKGYSTVVIVRSSSEPSTALKTSKTGEFDRFTFYDKYEDFEKSIQKKEFIELLHDLKKRYDFLLLSAPLFPQFITHPEHIAHEFENVLVGLYEETLPQIAQWFDLVDIGMKRLAFTLYENA